MKDLYLSIQLSLKEACKKWKVDQQYCKGDFDHSKVYNWATAEQHKEEVLDYLKLDVLALAELYKIYSKIALDTFKIDIYHSISPSQYAMQCWINMFGDGDNFPNIYIPHFGKEENDFRAAYYGGRVTPQRKEYESEDFCQHIDENGDLDYDKVTKFLFNADVNSLYPAVQFSHLYAHGRWKYLSTIGCKRAINKLNLLQDEEWINRCQFKVNISCPKDLITPFLVERDEKTGSLKHTLDDKKGTWYWGCELIEAIILGYKVTEVLEVIQFEKCSDLFSRYVNLCWQGRLNNPKKGVNANPVLNLFFKLMMNRLTGKFGQKSHSCNIAIFSTSFIYSSEEIKSQFKEILNRINDFTPIFCENENIALMLDLDNEDKNPDYPIYLSAQILARSRVRMSQIMRKGECYLRPSHAIYYTDTDSLVVPECVYPLWQKAGLLGSNLGQLSCDMHEWESEKEVKEAQFSKVVKGIWAAPKGPYSLVYVDPGQKKLMEKIRTKGIPHPMGPFVYRDDNEDKISLSTHKEIKHVINWIENPGQYIIPTQFIGKKFYLYAPNREENEQGEKELKCYFAKHLNFTLIQQMMQRDGILTCLFGGMKKTFLGRDGRMMEIQPDAVRRIPCKTNWWEEKALRRFEEDATVFDLSYPIGYQRGRESIDYEWECLEREAQL